MASAPVRAAIQGLGVCIPSRVLTNDDLARRVDTTDEWITARTGIKRRHIADPDQTTSDLAVAAGEQALAEADIAAEDLDLIIVGTATPDMFFPATACLVQDRLGARRAGAFDLLAACSSFVYGLISAAQLIQAAVVRHVLVIGAETLSRLIDWDDRRTCVLIGDGAGAAVLGPATHGRGIHSGRVGADGSAGEVLKVPAGGSRLPITREAIARKLHRATMDGQAVFKLAVRTIPELIRATVRQAGWRLADVDRFVPHQANLRIIESIRDQLGVSLEKFVVNIQEYGNTSAASVPIALWEAVRSRQIREGDRVVLAAFGGGFTYAACALVWGR
ncbi:MAG: beta-ketoacyl-ACP synthase III [Armatimonadota bacterium]|nr:beta-ketoacyl-ACP synthase III [Armatimonadota bacterium]MDR7450828.1 beta-ketoacyl-ACP synthase III [Armatimonadota bacterium]MDR7465749.1 beta-ketoacyl-ACP synthase III [Armatimonadota bacterium]MDR7493657.1 beta-ketoacyl-ACP synthase III [Armatimonadota bacterium]MDR7499094.1 beta-ketoacyl-ACP synthase III [Armatimonadota bacterium]